MKWFVRILLRILLCNKKINLIFLNTLYENKHIIMLWRSVLKYYKLDFETMQQQQVNNDKSIHQYHTFHSQSPLKIKIT